MSYRNQQNNNVTMIDDLPDIQDLDQNNNMELTGLNMIPPSESSKFQKYIKNNNNHNMHKSSGMHTVPMSNVPYNMYNQGSYIDSSLYYNPYNIHSSGALAPNSQQFYEPYENLKSNSTCLDLANHAENCPVCSRLYNNDKTIYILVIVVLCIICILLLKRVLEL